MSWFCKAFLALRAPGTDPPARLWEKAGNTTGGPGKAGDGGVGCAAGSESAACTVRPGGRESGGQLALRTGWESGGWFPGLL